MKIIILVVLTSLTNIASAADITFERRKAALVQSAYSITQCPELVYSGERLYDQRCLQNAADQFNRLAKTLFPTLTTLHIVPDARCMTGGEFYGLTVKYFTGSGMLMHSRELGQRVYHSSCIQNSVADLVDFIQNIQP